MNETESVVKVSDSVLFEQCQKYLQLQDKRGLTLVPLAPHGRDATPYTAVCSEVPGTGYVDSMAFLKDSAVPLLQSLGKKQVKVTVIVAHNTSKKEAY